MLHEGLGSARLWKNFPALLAQACGREVIAWSRQGYGYSADYPGSRQPDYLHTEAALLPDLLEALGFQRAHLFGHSDGASIALIAAARFPEFVTSLLLEAPHVFVETVTTARIGQLVSTFARSKLRQSLKRHHADGDGLFEDWSGVWLSPAFADWEIESLLSEIRSPALLIQGLADEFGTLSQLDRIAQGIGHATRVEIGRCGHWPHIEAEDVVIAAAKTFLERQD